MRLGHPLWTPLSVALSLASACIPEGPATGSDPAGPRTAATSASAAPSSQVKQQPSQVKQQPPPSQPAAEPDPPLTTPFRDDFQRAGLGAEWRALSQRWRLEGGELCAQRAQNRGVWLRRRLPPNARISFDARSHSAEGDIKAEFWGDGHSGASHVSYDDASGYIAIFGGWKNQLHVLARRDEHKADRQWVRLTANHDDFRARPVTAGQRYHFEVERRDGKTVRWLVDNVLIHQFVDAAPLIGRGHDHFGFNNWAVKVCFDNLRVEPLPAAG